jgi:hypothetical protein
MHLNREDGRVQTDCEEAADSHVFALGAVIVPVHTRKWSNCLNLLKGPQGLQRKLQKSV